MRQNLQRVTSSSSELETNTAAWKSRLNYRPNIIPVGAPGDKVLTVEQRAGDMRRTPAVHRGVKTLHDWNTQRLIDLGC